MLNVAFELYGQVLTCVTVYILHVYFGFRMLYFILCKLDYGASLHLMRSAHWLICIVCVHGAFVVVAICV
jgi:uncharacterized MAPEG superfamily protein